MALSLAISPLGSSNLVLLYLRADHAAAGITKGCNPPTNDQYCPTDSVTREQMAAMLRRAVSQQTG